MGMPGSAIVERNTSVSGEATVVAAARVNQAASPLVRYPQLEEKDRPGARTVRLSLRRSVDAIRGANRAQRVLSEYCCSRHSRYGLGLIMVP